jgi:plasmid replication initiation protein
MRPHDHYQNRKTIMTNLTKNGTKQTALKGDTGHFDEAVYRDELIAMGLPAEDAATFATKTANARRDALSANEYRLNLIASGVGEANAKRIAKDATRFLAMPDPKTGPEPQRVDGFQPLAGILGAGVLPGVKPGAAPASSMHARTEEIRANRRKLIEAQARPGETFEQAERRFLHESDRQPGASSSGQSPAARGTLRKPPEGDEQPDFFVTPFYDMGSRDSRHIMDVAVFRLGKKDKRAGELIRYELSDGFVEVSSSAYGMASVWDYDIVLMMVSHLTEAMNRYRDGKGEKPGRTFRPHVSDILKFARRGDGSRQVDEVASALDRLKGTTIKTERAGIKDQSTTAVGLINDYSILSKTDTGRISSVEIEAPKWIHKQIVEGNQPDVLTVHPDYFLITLGIGRFIYRLARRAAGKNLAQWSFRKIYERSGSTGTFNKFAFTLRAMIVANDLPEYSLTERPGKVGPLLVMTHRDALPDELPELPEDDDDASLPLA